MEEKEFILEKELVSEPLIPKDLESQHRSRNSIFPPIFHRLFNSTPIRLLDKVMFPLFWFLMSFLLLLFHFYCLYLWTTPDETATKPATLACKGLQDDISLRMLPFGLDMFNFLDHHQVSSETVLGHDDINKQNHGYGASISAELALVTDMICNDHENKGNGLLSQKLLVLDKNKDSYLKVSGKIVLVPNSQCELLYTTLLLQHYGAIGVLIAPDKKGLSAKAKYAMEYGAHLIKIPVAILTKPGYNRITTLLDETVLDQSVKIGPIVVWTLLEKPMEDMFTITMTLFVNIILAASFMADLYIMFQSAKLTYRSYLEFSNQQKTKHIN